MRASFVIEGGKELEQNLKTLGSRLEKGVIRKAVRAAQKIMVERAQAAARGLPHSSQKLFASGEEDLRMSELIARNIEIAAPKRQIAHSYALHVRIRPQREFYHWSKKLNTLTFIPVAIEFGHGASKETAARPYMRPASDVTTDARLRKIADELRVGILREAIRGRYAT